MEPVRSTRGALAWALIAAACGGAALGCNDPRKTAQSIAREEPAALSLGVDNRPGEGPAKAAPPNAAQTAPADGQSKAAPEAPADPAAPPSLDDVRDHLRGSLAGYKLPKHVVIAVPPGSRGSWRLSGAMPEKSD